MNYEIMTFNDIFIRPLPNVILPLFFFCICQVFFPCISYLVMLELVIPVKVMNIGDIVCLLSNGTI